VEDLDLTNRLNPLLEPLREAVQNFVHLGTQNLTHAFQLHTVQAAIHQMCAEIVTAKALQLPDELIREVVEPARVIHGCSAFIHRLQVWPRGYAGDFETIEYLMKQRVRAKPHSLEYWAEYMALNVPIAQQHRNKVLHQANLIAKTILGNEDKETKILILAAGSCPDLLMVRDVIKDRNFHITLNDADDDAIRFSLDRLGAIRHKLSVEHGNALTSVQRLSKRGPYDLVAGGLFDYLTDRYANFLIRNLLEKVLTTGGTFFFTNVACPNPYSIWIEYLANWKLIERTEEEIIALVPHEKREGLDIAVKRDATGLTLLTTLKKVGRLDLDGRI
jgi:extracellular factor (EF) 3-hydroxypalmitic acid methyl ester biosynthesis protein